MGFFTSYGTYVAPPDEEQSKEFEQEKKLRKDAVQAGYDKASLFGDAAKEYEKFMRQGMQAQGHACSKAPLHLAVLVVQHLWRQKALPLQLQRHSRSLGCLVQIKF
jgi:hypothetical protein